MLTIKQSATINRPIEEVFTFVADLENAPKFDPGNSNAATSNVETSASR